MKNAITILVLFFTVYSFSQTKKEIQSELDLKTAQLELFQADWNNDNHIYDDNLVHLNQLTEKKLDILKLQTKFKLIGLKKNTNTYSNILATQDVQVVKIKNDAEQERKRLEQAQKDIQMKLYEINNPSVIETK